MSVVDINGNSYILDDNILNYGVFADDVINLTLI